MKPLSGVLAAFALLLIVLAAGLRPDSFYAGDPGVKLVAAREALAHPAHPLAVGLPHIGTTSVPYVPPFFTLHGDHAHAITSPLFPLISAPLLKAFGLRGLYVLPAAGFLLTLWAIAGIAVGLDRHRRAMTMALSAGLGTPFLFYGLEYWEHSLALAAGASALLAWLRGRTFSAGLAIGLAVLFRPEAVWFGVAVAAAGPLLPKTARPARWWLAIAGAVVMFAPLEIYSLVHFGSAIPMHIGSNVGGLDQGWMAGRLALVSRWLLSTSDASFWRVAPVVAVAVLTSLAPSRAGRAFLWTVALLDIALVVLTAPNDGGGQWGPRYLLFAYLPLAILAGDTIDLLPIRRASALLAIAAVVVGCVWIQRTAYRQLQGTKISYGRIVDFVREEVSPGDAFVTDLWWLDQIAAATTADRQVLYADNAEEGRAIVRALSDARVNATTIIRAGSPSDTRAWLEGNCFRETSRDRISTRDLLAIRLRRQCD